MDFECIRYLKRGVVIVDSTSLTQLLNTADEHSAARSIPKHSAARSISARVNTTATS